MRVHIGPYIDWIGPYQISQKILFWIPEYDKDGHNNKTVFEFGTWLATNKDGKDSYLMKVCNWIHSKNKRKVKIKIDKYDHWNAHNTASMVLLPLIKELQKHKQGSGFIDDEDVPDNLKSTSAPPKENEYDTDELFSDRYDWVLSEIIFALESDQPDNDWESQFTHEQAEIDFTDYPEDEGKTFIPLRWKTEGKYDWEGRKTYQARIDNGFRLMGKYWQTFWD